MPSTQTNFTATSGGRVVLPCPIQPGALLQQYSFLWLKDDELIIESQYQYSPSIAGDSRYQINVSTFSLIIDPVSVNDSSMNYQCIVVVTRPITGSRFQLVSSQGDVSPRGDVLLSLSISEGILRLASHHAGSPLAKM